LKKKKKILLHWFEMEGRPELLEPFVDNSNEVDYYHLYFYSREDRKVNLSPFSILYWYDFSSPFQLLQRIKPDKVILANGVSLYEVSLIIACNLCQIPVYCLQHGIMAPGFFKEIEDIKVERNLKKVKYYYKVSRFYFSNISKVPRKTVPALLRFYCDAFTKGLFYACHHNHFSLRYPTGYICFTMHNAKYFLERDQIGTGKILSIGVPCFDHFFQTNKSIVDHEGPYALLIDTVMTEGGKPVSEEYMNNYYRIFNEYCRKKGWKLAIKLHPWAYKYNNLLLDNNIVYHRNIDKEELTGMIKNAQVVFSFFSTLLFPSLFINPRIVAIDHPVHHFPDELTGNGRLQKVYLDEHGTISLSDDFAYDQNFLNEIRENYLYKVDGKSKERLKEIIES
jgi:hypothetical protein